MSVLIDHSTRLIVQGITGREGTFHAKQAQAYGTNVVGGVTPGKGGTTHEGWPVFNTVADAVRETGANASVIFVPPPGGADAVMEAADAGLALAVCITEGIPTIDMMRALAFVRRTPMRLIGPNCPGLISAGPREGRHHPRPHLQGRPRRHRVEERHADLRSHPPAHRSRARPDDLHRHRRRSADRHVVHRRARAVRGDPETEAVVLIGEIGGNAEEDAAAFIKASFKKPVVGFIAGQTAPPGRRMGHAGAIIAGGKGTAAEKMAALTDGRRARRQEPGRHRPRRRRRAARKGSGAFYARRHASIAPYFASLGAARPAGAAVYSNESVFVSAILLLKHECTVIRHRRPSLTSPARNVVNDFSIQVATVNGSGSQTANLVLLRSIFQMGIPVSGKNLFPSNIAGLPTWYTIRANHRGYIARKKEIDFLVAMNAETAKDDVLSLEPGRAVVYDEPLKLDTLRTDLTFYPVPFDKIVAAVCPEAKLRRLVKNMIYDGILSELLSIDLDEMEKALHKQLGKKPKAMALNMAALEAGKKYAAEHLTKRDPVPRRPHEQDGGAGPGRRQRRRGDGLHVRRRHRRRLVSDHAVVVAARVAHRLHAEVPHGQGDGQGDVRDRPGRGRDRGARHGGRRELGRRARDDVHVRARASR